VFDAVSGTESSSVGSRGGGSKEDWDSEQTVEEITSYAYEPRGSGRVVLGRSGSARPSQGPKKCWD